jgi:hypothetical protein
MFEDNFATDRISEDFFRFLNRCFRTSHHDVMTLVPVSHVYYYDPADRQNMTKHNTNRHETLVVYFGEKSDKLYRQRREVPLAQCLVIGNPLRVCESSITPCFNSYSLLLA